MITQEMFDGIVKKVVQNEGCTVEETTELVQTVAELEQRVLVAQQIVEFVLGAVERVYNDATDVALRDMHIRDLGKVKQIRAIGPKAAKSVADVVQLYLMQIYAQIGEELAVGETDPGVLDNEPTA